MISSGGIFFNSRSLGSLRPMKYGLPCHGTALFAHRICAMRGINRVILLTEISVFTGVTNIRCAVELAAMKRLEILADLTTIIPIVTFLTRVKADGTPANFSLHTPIRIFAVCFWRGHVYSVISHLAHYGWRTAIKARGYFAEALLQH